MKKLVLSVIVISPFLVTHANAAYTCAQQAGICMKKGGSAADCNEASRMASCRSTGVYVGPSGRSWPAKKEK
jgi:hypothetical protein